MDIKGITDHEELDGIEQAMRMASKHNLTSEVIWAAVKHALTHPHSSVVESMSAGLQAWDI